MPFKQQRIRDPVHNLIEFEASEFDDVLWRVLQTQPFQRLRRIKQLGFSDFVYPGATHSRFAHSVGVFHTARRLMAIVKEHLGTTAYQEMSARTSLAAALVHDVGHGPFSHAFEEVGKRFSLKLARHEVVSDALIRDSEISECLKKYSSGFHNDVADAIKSPSPGNIYAAVVSSQFDADRLDYMQRDRLMAGTRLAQIDFQWLVDNLEVGSVPYGVDTEPLGKVETFVVGPKAIYAAEAYVLALFQLYPTVYFHKATRCAEKIFTELLAAVFSSVREGNLDAVGLPANHPLVRFSKDPEKIDWALQLDDSVVWGALSMLADAKHPTIAQYAVRLRDRRLYKCIDIRAEVSRELGEAASDLTRVEKACSAIEQVIEQWKQDNACSPPRLLIDRAVREPYKRFQESKGPLNQILIRTAEGALVDLGERSKVVAAIEPFQLFRAYIASDDTKARTFLLDTIKKEATP